MMEVTMKLAVSWMQIGLPLQLLKIVVFSHYPDDPQEMKQECVQVFKELKQKIEAQRENAIPRVSTVI